MSVTLIFGIFLIDFSIFSFEFLSSIIKECVISNFLKIRNISFVFFISELKSLNINKEQRKSVIRNNDEDDESVFRIIIKCGTDGSVDAVKKVLETIENEDVNIEITHSSSGSVNENDVMLATAANAVVVGFQTVIEQGAIRQSRTNDIAIKNYDIVYEMVDELTEMVLKNRK